MPDNDEVVNGPDDDDMDDVGMPEGTEIDDEDSDDEFDDSDE